MMNINCPVCGRKELHEIVYSEKKKIGRRAIEVVGLKKTACEACQAEFVLPEQHDWNIAAVADHAARTRTGITRGLLRRLREVWGLSQRDASKIFGAGEMAFAKWETGKELSTPSALLVQAAMNVRGVMPYLAKLANVQLDAEGPNRVEYVLEGRGDAWTRVESLDECVSSVTTSTLEALAGKDDALAAFNMKWPLDAIPEHEWEDCVIAPMAVNDDMYALAA